MEIRGRLVHNRRDRIVRDTGCNLREAAGETDGMRGAEVERPYDFARGESSEGTNPMSVTGTKQGRRDREGASRQEVEKT